MGDLLPDGYFAGQDVPGERIIGPFRTELFDGVIGGTCGGAATGPGLVDTTPVPFTQIGRRLPFSNSFRQGLGRSEIRRLWHGDRESVQWRFRRLSESC